MHRRRFLALGSSGLASAVLPQLLGCASRGRPLVPEELPPPSSDVSAAMVRAQALGKPLLIILRPADSQVGIERGQFFGRWLNEGSDEVMSDLALCEVICAGGGAIRSVQPKWPASSEPWMLFVAAGSSPHAFEMAMPDDPIFSASGYEEYARIENEQLDRGTSQMARWVHDHVAADAAVLNIRAESSRATLDESRRQAIADAALDPSSADRALADRGAALLLEHAMIAGTEPEARSLLASAARVRLRGVAPPGSRWARVLCGIDVEGDESPRTPCGMSHVSRDVGRFLYFYSRA